MRRGKGKAKGSSFERLVCAKLSLWWTSGGRDDCFWRTASSGGRCTVRSRKGKATANSSGDVCATDGCGAPFLRAFAVEVKRGYNSCTLQDLLDAPAGAAAYARWADQAEASREQSGALYWLVVLKRDRRAELAMVPSALCCELPWLRREPHAEAAGLVLFRLDDLLGRLSPAAVSGLLVEGVP